MSIFLVKLIGQWIPNGDGQGIARDIKKIVFIFKTRQKMVTKWGQFTKAGPFSTFQLFKLSKLCYYFCWVLKMKIIFLYIPSCPPPIAVRNSLTNQFCQKYWPFCIFSTTTKKCKTEMLRRVLEKLVTILLTVPTL